MPVLKGAQHCLLRRGISGLVGKEGEVGSQGRWLSDDLQKLPLARCRMKRASPFSDSIAKTPPCPSASKGHDVRLRSRQTKPDSSSFEVYDHILGQGDAGFKLAEKKIRGNDEHVTEKRGPPSATASTSPKSSAGNFKIRSSRRGSDCLDGPMPR